jgi:hypothetical protein
MKRIWLFLISMLFFTSCSTLLPIPKDDNGILVIAVNGERKDDSNYVYYRLYYSDNKYIAVYPKNEY